MCYDTRNRYSLILMMLPMLASCGGVSDNIYILADTSMPAESVEEEFCRKTVYFFEISVYDSRKNSKHYG